jgi:hypothetical protein
VDNVKRWLAAQEDYPEARIWKGDLLRWDRVLGLPDPFIQSRRRSFDYDLILLGLNSGVLEPVITHAALKSELRAAERAAAEALRPQLRLLRSKG